MSNEPFLTIGPCSYEAAKFAVLNWHYSHAMPVGKVIRYGIWEDRFIGAVLYARGANNNLGTGHGLMMDECCELVRVALREHRTPVSQIVSQTLQALRESNPGLRLVYSYADTEQGHRGGIYQAGNWLYLGQTTPADEYVVNGRRLHGRQARAMRQDSPHKWDTTTINILEWMRKHVDPAAYPIQGSMKHRYVMPLDKQMRRRMVKLAQPYPPAVEVSDGDTPNHRLGEAGSIPADRSNV